MTTITKKTMLLEREPIAQTDDGKVKVMTFKDGGSATNFTLGNAWAATGEGFYEDGSAPEGEWGKTEIGLQIGENYISFPQTIAADHKSFTLGEYLGDKPPVGVYENVVLQFTVSKAGLSQTLELPIAKLTIA